MKWLCVTQCSELWSLGLQLWDLQLVFLPFAFHLPPGLLTTLWIQLDSCSEWTSACFANIWPGTEQLMKCYSWGGFRNLSFCEKRLRYICWKLLILLLNDGNFYCSSITFINQSNRFGEERPFWAGKLALEMRAQSAGSLSEECLLPRSLCGEPRASSQLRWFLNFICTWARFPSCGRGGSVKPSLHEWKVLAATTTNLINLIAHFCLLCLAWAHFLMTFPVWGSEWWLNH